MTQREFTIPMKLGLHAKPSSMFVNEALKFKCSISVNKDGLEINGKSIMGLMLLAAEHGARIVVKADGPDEKQALEALGKLFERRFDEE